MARIRTIKPGFWKNEALSELPPDTHMLAAALLNYADDEGYFNANQKLICAECCPLRDLSVSIHESLMHLSNIGYIRLGKSDDGRVYGRVINFLNHQVVNRPTPSEIRVISISWNNHGLFSEASVTEGKGREGKGKGMEEEYTCEFDNFWNLYPNKKAKPNAFKAYTKAIKKGVPHETIIRGLGQHADYWRANGTERKFIPHPATWLNGERWNDDICQAGGNGPAHGGRGAQDQVGGVLGAGLRLLERERAAGR